MESLDDMEEISKYFFSKNEINIVLINVIQKLSPSGIGYRSHKECIKIQILNNNKISEKFSLNENQMIIGYIYIGTPAGKKKSLPKMNTNDFISVWD